VGRLATFFFLITGMAAVDTIGAIVIGGGQAFTWLVVLFALVLIPSALRIADRKFNNPRPYMAQA
jgi:hypothetical protein